MSTRKALSEQGTCTEQSAAQQFQEGLVQDRGAQQFVDFIVFVDDVEFRCHRFALATRSGFFRTLLSSSMKESKEGKATLPGMPSAVFASLLEWIYEGETLLSQDNVFDVLVAADRLDTQGLVSECINYLTQSISQDNCVSVYQVSKAFNEKSLEEKSWAFLLENFDTICTSEEFYKLTDQEILLLVSDPLLHTQSEDLVIDSILRWVRSETDLVSDEQQAKTDSEERESSTKSQRINPKGEEKDLTNIHVDENAEPVVSHMMDNGAETLQHNSSQDDEISATTGGLKKTDSYGNITTHSNNPRIKTLADLLDASRYLLVSGNCVWQTLARDPLIQADSRCRAVQQKILRYQTQLDVHQAALVSAAEHRWSTHLRDVLVAHTGDTLVFINLRIGLIWYELKVDCPGKAINSLVFFDSNIYLTDGKKRLHVFNPINGTWGILTEAKDNVRIVAMVPVGNDFFIVVTADSDRYSVERLSIPSVGTAQWLKVGEFITRGMEVASITNIGTKLVVFWRQAGQACLRIECFDLVCLESFLLPDHLSSTSGLVTFKHDDEAFALQENGSLWRISVLQAAPYIQVEYQLSLWNFHRALGGAILVRGNLMVFENKAESTETSEVSATEGKKIFMDKVFKELKFIKSPPTLQGFVHSVLPRRILRFDETKPFQ